MFSTEIDNGLKQEVDIYVKSGTRLDH